MDKNIIYKNPTELLPYIGNAKKHPAKQIDQIAASIREFGFNNPVLLDGKNDIIAGHGRVEAAKKLGLEKVPCLILDHMTDAQKRAYILADNRLAENGEWDKEILNAELERLMEDGFDIDLTGFDFDSGSPEAKSPEDNDEVKKDYGIFVETKTEEEQKNCYDILTEAGFACKLLS